VSDAVPDSPDAIDIRDPLFRHLERWLDSEWKCVAVVLSIGVLILLPGLGSTGLWDCWEPHYAEVARNLLARDDLVHPYWDSAYFFSKPILPMWLMAASMWLFGIDVAPLDAPLGPLTEWAVRLPSALLALITLWATYRIGRHHSRPTGVIAAFILATSAQFIFLGKQATVDMPLVAFTTLALMHLLEALLPDTPETPPTAIRWLTALGLLLATLPQLAVLNTELSAPYEQLALAILAPLSIIVAIAVIRSASHATCHLVAFAIFLALAALSKGLAPFALLGPPVVLYAAISRDPKILLLPRLPLLALILLLVAGPWFTTMSLFGGLDEHEMTFTERFWLFDNLERASLGVIGDRGGFTYYLEQLAYASFPWVALAPLALSNIVRNTSPRVKFLLITTLWILGFFTLLETKFHHYVFPILPTFSILIALYITTRTPGRSPLFWVSLALFLLVMRDLLVTPSKLANLFVYKYDRPYPTAEDGVHATLGLAIIFVPALLTVAYAIFCRKSLILISTLSIFIYATWLSHCHFRELSPHWSQRHLIETYFNTRAPGEPLFAFNLNWRGENFYTRNQVIPVIWDDSDARIRAYVDAPGRAFILTERTTLPDLEAALSEDARSRIRLIDETSQKYGIYLVDD
jgi:4-amino-4-deoxy-L-arabinose transferase-like glycosyltransferase